MVESLEMLGHPEWRPLVGDLIPGGKDRVPLQAADLLCWYTKRPETHQLTKTEVRHLGVLAHRRGTVMNGHTMRLRVSLSAPARSRLNRACAVVSFVLGAVYHVEGVLEHERKLKFVGRLKIGKKRHEHLVFKPLRKTSKYRKSQ
jgi:hypothetical protein